MPYVALQLVGVQVVLLMMGMARASGRWSSRVPGAGSPLTYSSGLRAPALIAFVKDALIYIVIIVAVIYIPTQLGGWDDIFAATSAALRERRAMGRGRCRRIPADALAYISLALGSALALFSTRTR